MPLFTSRLNTVADTLVSSAVIVYLHTDAPSERVSCERQDFGWRRSIRSRHQRRCG